MKPRPKSHPESLNKLRSEIRDITRSILNLAKARQALSEKVALIKQSEQLPVENKEVESELIDSMEKYASSIGLEPKLAERVTKDLIEASKSAQRRAIYFPKIRENLAQQGVRRVGIVGSGRMGSWFASYFKPLVTSVSLYDSNKRLGRKRASELGCEFANSLDEIATSDLVLVAVPISGTLEITKLLLMKQTKARIIEIASVKEKLLRGLGKRGANAYSIHPLFGPSAAQFGENSLILVGSRSQERFLRSVFPHCKIVRLSAREHDKSMILSLSLPHALALVFAGIASREKNRTPSPSYDALLQMARKTLSENPQIYYEIQSLNRYNQRMLREIKNSIAMLERFLSGGDYAEFREFFLRAKKNLGE